MTAALHSNHLKRQTTREALQLAKDEQCSAVENTSCLE